MKNNELENPNNSEIAAIDAAAQYATHIFIRNHPPEKCGILKISNSNPSIVKSFSETKRENDLYNESLSRRAHAMLYEITSTKDAEETERSAMQQSKLLELTSVIGYLRELKAKAKYIEIAELCISELQLLKLKDLRHDYVDRLHEISSRWKKGKEDYHAELKKIWG